MTSEPAPAAAAPAAARGALGPGHRRPGRGVGAALVGLGLLAAYTLVTWAVPAVRGSWYAPGGRAAVEVAGLCLALFVALALLLPDDGDTPVTRNAFVASLVTLGLSNVAFGVAPLLAGAGDPFGGFLSFYPWLAARYVVGVLFVAAAMGRPRWPLGWYLAAVVGLLAAVDLALLAWRDVLPLPAVDLELTPGGVLVPVTTRVQEVVVALAPAGLFGLGAWQAGQTYRRGASPLYLWVAVALAVHVLANVHEVLYPAVLGPSLTTADALRIVFGSVLLAGALHKVRQVVVDRGTAVRALQDDLAERERHLRAMAEFTDREHAFRSLVVHELGTPLATVRTLAHVVASASDDAEGRVRRGEAAEAIAAEAARLEALVARMEDLRDLEQDPAPERRPVRLRPLVEELAGYARGLPGGHPVAVRWDCGDVVVHADPVRLAQALRDVVGNAARYSPDETPIAVTCTPAAPGRVRVAVEDRGPGIPPSERDRVRRKFARGRPGAPHPGTGLGLYLADRVAEAHGGQLLIDEPESGAGTVVALDLGVAEETP